MEQLGAKVGLDSRQVGEDLKRFKQLVETTGRRDGRLARRGARGRANELRNHVPRGPMVPRTSFGANIGACSTTRSSMSR